MKKIKALLSKRVENKKNEKGFSLVELIIVIAILGIIAAIAVPNVMGSLDKAKKNTDLTNARAIANAATMAKADGRIKTSDSETDITGDTELKKELNGGIPQLKLDDSYSFKVILSKNGEVTVNAYKSDTEKYELFPTLDPDTDNPWK